MSAPCTGHGASKAEVYVDVTDLHPAQFVGNLPGMLRRPLDGWYGTMPTNEVQEASMRCVAKSSDCHDVSGPGLRRSIGSRR